MRFVFHIGPRIGLQNYGRNLAGPVQADTTVEDCGVDDPFLTFSRVPAFAWYIIPEDLRVLSGEVWLILGRAASAFAFDVVYLFLIDGVVLPGGCPKDLDSLEKWKTHADCWSVSEVIRDVREGTLEKSRGVRNIFWI